MNQKVNFAQAKKLKELGYDVPEYDFYNQNKPFTLDAHIVFKVDKEDFNRYGNCTSAPLISSALEWCMENFGVYNTSYKFVKEVDEPQDWQVIGDAPINDVFKSYPQAQSACLDLVLAESDKIKNKKI